MSVHFQEDIKMQRKQMWISVFLWKQALIFHHGNRSYFS